MECIGTLVGGEFKPSREVSLAGFFSFENLPLLSQNQLLLIKEVLSKSEPIKQFSIWDRIKRKWLSKKGS
jgi:hypothetical protein